MAETDPSHFTNCVAGTPGGSRDRKREASSPLVSDDTFVDKRTRHGSNTSIINRSAGANLLGPVDEIEMGGGSPQLCTSPPTHHPSKPLHPPDVILIAGELRSLMLPEIKVVIRDAVHEATAKMLEEIRSLKEENARLQTAYESLEKRLVTAEEENENLEQYSRRNSLRISGIPEAENESTDDLVRQLAEDLEVEISDIEIDRSHRVGRPDDGKRGKRSREIIVKFTRYNTRNKLYQVRKQLRDKPSRKTVFINEDLTRKRSKLLFDARTLVRVKALKAAYSFDGRIFVRDLDDKRHLIKSNADICQFGDVNGALRHLESRRSRR